MRLSQNKIIITGATGFIGRYLVDRLLRQNAKIEVITRAKERVPQEWQGRVSVLECDISKNNCQITPNTEIVFHCAGEIHDSTKFFSTNVEGTKNLLEMSVQAGVKKFVYLSSVGVMGKDKAGTFDETSLCVPRNDYEISKLEAENLVLTAGLSGDLSVSVLRPSIVYSPGRNFKKDSFLSLVRSIKNGYFRYIGSANNTYNIVYIEDVVEALCLLMLKPVPNNDNIFIVNDPISWGDFVARVQSILNFSCKIGIIPESLAYCMALGCEIGNKMCIELPFSIQRFKALTSKTAFSSEKIQKEMGFKFQFGNEKGLKKTVEWYVDNGLL